MLRLSKKMFYAVEAVLYIAYNTKSEPISSRDIADRQGLPPRYLEQIMQKLVKAGILRGVRGPHGGYVLAKERRRITVADICDVVRDMDEIPLEDLKKTALGGEVILPLCNMLYDHLRGQLGDLCMAKLCQQASDHRIRRERDESADFAI